MAIVYRSPSLETDELMAFYEEGRERYSVKDDDCTSEGSELDSTYNKEERGMRGKRSLSLEIYGLQRHDGARQVLFSNQEYYWRLEELKQAHLRNMAELERLYVNQVKNKHSPEDDGDLERDAKEPARVEWDRAIPARSLQRINSQEELDFHESSSISDQSESYGEDSLGEAELDHPHRTTQDRAFRRDVVRNPEGTIDQRRFHFQPQGFRLQPGENPSRPTEIRHRSNTKVTIPKPFKMMLREEERKRHRVRTRSEVELENTLLRKELEELLECNKKFRASPAPAHTHLPLYESISRRTGRPPITSNQYRANGGGSNHGRRFNTPSLPSSTSSPLRPFSFLERERRKKEERIVAELGNTVPKEEQRLFRARPMPNSVYASRHRKEQRSDAKFTGHSPQSPSFALVERGDTEGCDDTGLDQEERVHHKLDMTTHDTHRRQPAKPVKKQIELSIEMVKEKEWSYSDPLTTSCSVCSSLSMGGSQGTLPANRNDCISV